MKLISVIIPVYKVEKFIGRCLDCLIAQTYPHWEAICVNDGSPDSSRDIVAGYALKDGRIKLLDKANGGVSSARNSGLGIAKGDFVIFLDSDDFLHPQTLEIAMSIAERDGSDMVTWYKNPYYRNITFIRHKLGLDTIDFRPRGFSRRFDLAKARTVCTGRLHEHLTEYSHPKGIDTPVKHFYVWRMMTKRSLIGEQLFDTSISFGEEFPWWTEILLKQPKVSITNLPFYFYYPNLNSLDLGGKRLRKILYWCRGLEKSWTMMEEGGDADMKRNWSGNCKWPVVNVQITRRLLKFTRDSGDGMEIAGILRRLKAQGCFSDAVTHADKKGLEIIRQFIGE